MKTNDFVHESINFLYQEVIKAHHTVLCGLFYDSFYTTLDFFSFQMPF